LERFLKGGQISSHIGGVYAPIRTNPRSNVLEAWFASKRANESQVGHVQAAHRKCLPLPCRFERRNLAVFRRADYILEDFCEIGAQLGTVFVPVSHGADL
jgi:hypothetical protein